MSQDFLFDRLSSQRRTSLYFRVLISTTLILIFSSPVMAHAIAATDLQQPSAVGSSSMPDAPLPQNQEVDPVTLRNTPIHMLKDQGAIWTSPLRAHTHDLIWLLPLAAATGAGIATDHHVMSSIVTHDSRFNQHNIDASNVILGGFIAAPVAAYGLGYLKEDPHARETGILGAEALIDGVVVEQGLKLIFWRERPGVNNARGRFFQSSAGVDSSLPSSHSLLAWSSAAVIAAEYPSPWAQLGVYPLATGVSVTRVLGQEHFPTDVLLGSAAGWLVGHYVYRARHKHARSTR